MMRLKRHLWVVLALLTSVSAVNAQEDSRAVRASLDRSRIYQGESVRYSVEVQNVDNAPQPDLSGFHAYRVEYLGASTSSRFSTQLIGGRRVVESVQSVVFSYQLTPGEVGVQVVPAPELNLGQEVLVGNTVQLDVVPPRQQDLVVFDSQVTRKGDYPLQPFTVSLRVFVKKLPPPYEKQDPLSPLESAPDLTVPWAEIPEGLTSEDVSQWLSPLVARSGSFDRAAGFKINGMTTQGGGGLFSVFDQPRKALFDLGGRPATPSDTEDVPDLRGKAGGYFVYTLRRTFIPLYPGRFDFDACSVKGEFVADVQNQRAVSEGVYDLGGSVSVDVSDAPSSGRPASFSGAFGRRFSLDLDVQPRRARVGDPLTVSLGIRGQGNLGDFGPPDLLELESISSQFQVERPTVDLDGDYPIYTYSIRARSSDVQELPAFSFSWFDTDRSRYETVETDSIALEIDEIDTLSAADIVRAGSSRENRKELTLAEGMFGNITDSRKMKNWRVSSGWLLGYPTALILTFMTIAFVSFRKKRRSEDPQLRRRHGAERQARMRLNAALVDLNSGDHDRGAEAAAFALTGLISAAASVSEAGMTAAEAEQNLRVLGVDGNLAGRVGEFLKEVDGMRYGGGTAVDVGTEAKTLLEETVRSLRKRGALK